MNSEVKPKIFTNSRVSTGVGNETALCGFPSFCSLDAAVTCFNTSLSECEECSMVAAGFLIAFYVMLGAFIVLGNGFILWNVILRKNGFDDTYGKIRGSFAIADIIAGFQVFAVILPSLGETLQYTAHELDVAERVSEGSVGAIIGGVLYLLGFSSSLYHLVLLSAHRFYAIAWPIHFHTRAGRSVYIGLIVVWCLAITISTFPVWFPKRLTFTYYSTIFLYFPSYVTGGQKLVGAAVISLIILLIYPYVIMMILSFAALGKLFCYCKKKVNSLVASPLNSKKRRTAVCKREVNVLKTVMFMQFGFTLTLVPLAVATGLFYSGHLNCQNFSSPYLICFVMSICNSLVNIVIYFIFDMKFRTAVDEAFGHCKFIKRKKKSEENKTPPGSCRRKQDSSSFNTTTGSSSLVLMKQLTLGSKRKNILTIELPKK